MGRVKDKLMELEDEGVIRWDSESNSYVLVDTQEPVPFDLAQYLFERHQAEAAESTDYISEEEEDFWS